MKPQPETKLKHRRLVVGVGGAEANPAEYPVFGGVVEAGTEAAIVGKSL